MKCVTSNYISRSEPLSRCVYHFLLNKKGEVTKIKYLGCRSTFPYFKPMFHSLTLS